MQNSLQVKLIFEYYLQFVSLTVNLSLRQLHKTVPVEISGIKWLSSKGQIKMSQWCQTETISRLSYWAQSITFDIKCAAARCIT